MEPDDLVSGLPSSSSHALFGGLIGATWVAGGADAIHFNTVLNKVILPALLSPVVAALIAMTVTFLALRVITRAKPGLARRGFKRGQAVSSSMLALAHGTNDAQKTMGVITLTLITSGLLAPGSAPPFWVVLSAGLAIALGTYMGGWRIIRTLGRRVSDIRPVQGFAAETTSAAVILTSTHLGLPLSTTPGVHRLDLGSRSRPPAGRGALGKAGRIALGWSFTLPAAALVGAAASWLAATGPIRVLIVAITGWPWPPHLRRIPSLRRERAQRQRPTTQRHTTADHRRHRRLTRRRPIPSHRLGNPDRGRDRRRGRCPHRRPAVAFARVGLSLHSEQHADRPPRWGTGTRTTIGRVVAGPACSPPG